VYRLFKRIPEQQGLQLICQYVREHLEAKGRLLVHNEQHSEKNPIKFVQSILDLKDQYDRFLQNAFSKDDRVRTAINAV
jgi:cullin 3